MENEEVVLAAMKKFVGEKDVLSKLGVERISRAHDEHWTAVRFFVKRAP